MPRVADVIAFLGEFAPLTLAADWDNVGLLLGDRAAEVRRLMTCLTVTADSAAEAVADQADLVVTHHPVLFRGAKRLTTDSPEGRMVLALVRAGVAVYSPHTAFDNTAGGINDCLASLLGLADVAPLRPRPAGKQVKIVAFVPDQDLPRVSDALFAAGAGVIGQYRECSFRLAGTGTFFGTEGANPAVGQKGRREDVAEWRLEVVCPESRLDAAVAALRRAHSYEEPACDLYPLLPARTTAGEGRIGVLKQSQPLGDLARLVKQGLRAGAVQLVGDPARPVTRVALACGAAGEFLADAVRARADAFVSGEMRFHDYLSAQEQGVGLVLPGHYATERPAVEHLAERLGSQWPDIHAWASVRERDPVLWI